MAETMPARRHSLLQLMGWPFQDDMSWPARFREAFVPEMKVEEFADGDQFVVRVEIPGIDPDKDAEISVTNGMLLIKAHRRSEKREEKEGEFRSEFSYGSFERHLPLPEGSDANDVKATYSDGILEIRMPLRIPAPEITPIPVTRV